MIKWKVLMFLSSDGCRYVCGYVCVLFQTLSCSVYNIVYGTIFFNTHTYYIYYSRAEFLLQLSDCNVSEGKDILKIVIIYQKVYKYFDFVLFGIIHLRFFEKKSRWKSAICNCLKKWKRMQFATLQIFSTKHWLEWI